MLAGITEHFRHAPSPVTPRHPQEAGRGRHCYGIGRSCMVHSTDSGKRMRIDALAFGLRMMFTDEGLDPVDAVPRRIDAHEGGEL